VVLDEVSEEGADEANVWSAADEELMRAGEGVAVGAAVEDEDDTCGGASVVLGEEGADEANAWSAADEELMRAGEGVVVGAVVEDEVDPLSAAGKEPLTAGDGPLYMSQLSTEAAARRVSGGGTTTGGRQYLGAPR
jgi:hypothetical protein